MLSPQPANAFVESLALKSYTHKQVYSNNGWVSKSIFMSGGQQKKSIEVNLVINGDFLKRNET